MASEWDQFPDADQWNQFPDAPESLQTTLGLANSITTPGGAPEKGSGGFSEAIKAGLIRDPGTLRRELAKSLFPNDPNGISRVGFDDNGRPTFINDEGKVQYVSGNWSQFLGNAVANLPEMIGGAVGSLTASPVIGGTLGVAGTKGMKQAAVGMAYDEPQSIQENVADIGTEAALEYGLGLAGKGVVTVLNRGRALDARPRDLSRATANRDRIRQETGVEVDLATASNDRRLLGLRNFLAQQPNQTSDAIQAFDEKAASQFDAATRRVLDSIAPAQSSSELGQPGINAAKGAIDTARREVSSAVEPLYRQAYNAMPQVTDPAVLAFMSRPSFKAADQIAVKLAADEGRPYADDVFSLERLDNVKRGLDTLIDKAQKNNDRNQLRVLTKAKNEFTSALDNLSNDLYKTARSEYETLYKDRIEPLEKGWVGVLANINDRRAASAAAKILKDGNVMPADIARVRAELSKQDPESWNMLVRQFIANEWKKARTATQSAQEVNSPGKLFQAVWGDEGARARMTAALGMQGVMALQSLMQAAEALAKTPIRGSNTQPNQAIKSALEGPSGWWARSLLSPRQTVIETALRKNVDDNSLKLWQGLSDPTKQSQLRVALKIADPTRRAIYISSVLLGQTGQAAASTQDIESQQQ